MKCVFIVYNQANTERVEYMLDRRGTHTWPEMNSGMMTVVDDDKVEELLQTVRKLDNRNREVGVRAFVWNIEQTV